MPPADCILPFDAPHGTSSPCSLEMNDPVGCTALVLYAGDAADGSLADAEAGGDAAIPAGSSGGSSGGDRRGGQPSCTASACPPQQDNPSHQQASAAPRRFVGLSNQGATCYMNSLLQTLYMTPEVCGVCIEQFILEQACIIATCPTMEM